MKKILPLFALMAGLSLAQAQDTFFNVFLDGLQEVPPVATPGSGSGTMVLHTDMTLDYSVSFSGLIGSYTASHIHGPAGVGTNAGVIFPLPLSTGGGSAGTLVGTVGPLTAAQKTDLLGGLWYVNIHSTFRPGGEIRGQIQLIPEPSVAALVTVGAGLLLWRCRRRR